MNGNIAGCSFSKYARLLHLHFMRNINEIYLDSRSVVVAIKCSDLRPIFSEYFFTSGGMRFRIRDPRELMLSLCYTHRAFECGLSYCCPKTSQLHLYGRLCWRVSKGPLAPGLCLAIEFAR